MKFLLPDLKCEVSFQWKWKVLCLLWVAGYLLQNPENWYWRRGKKAVREGQHEGDAPMANCNKIFFWATKSKRANSIHYCVIFCKSLWCHRYGFSFLAWKTLPNYIVINLSPIWISVLFKIATLEISHIFMCLKSSRLKMNLIIKSADRQKQKL